METIAAYTIFLIQLVGDGIHISLSRHCLVEGGIEDTHLRQARHQFLHGIHTLQVSRVVQGSQVRALLKGLQHLVSQHYRLIELLATMHHTMAHSINLIETLDDANLWVCQQ